MQHKIIVVLKNFDSFSIFDPLGVDHSVDVYVFV